MNKSVLKKIAITFCVVFCVFLSVVGFILYRFLTPSRVVYTFGQHIEHLDFVEATKLIAPPSAEDKFRYEGIRKTAQSFQHILAEESLSQNIQRIIKSLKSLFSLKVQTDFATLDEGHGIFPFKVDCNVWLTHPIIEANGVMVSIFGGLELAELLSNLENHSLKRYEEIITNSELQIQFVSSVTHKLEEISRKTPLVYKTEKIEVVTMVWSLSDMDWRILLD